MVQVLHREAQGPGKVAIIEEQFVHAKQKMLGMKAELLHSSTELEGARRTIAKHERSIERWKAVVQEQGFLVRREKFRI